MASNHTEHIGLSQWDLSDSVVMADFNEDNRKIDAALAAGMKIQTGTYVGTGKSGSSNPNVLTFEFTPKLVLINGILEGDGDVDENDHFCLTAVYGTQKCRTMFWGTNNSSTATLHWTDNSLSWYSITPQKQGNWAGISYHYVAIG